ncbi:TonB family protein [Dasania marina]|uniref:TonB family protein n=1 Tax=Dasania marina TaxID=471499 RepID=UPI000373D3A0|nr:TonB family protein [Dasania marina]
MKKIIGLFWVVALSILSSASYASVEPTVAEFKRSYAAFSGYADKKQWKQSLPYAESAYEIALKLYGEDHKNTATLAYNYGLNLLDVNQKDEAAKILKKALAMYERVYGEDSIELIALLIDLGHSKAHLFRNGGQKSYYNRALELSAKYYGDDSLEHAKLSSEIGLELLLRTRSIAARTHLENSYKIYSDKLGENSSLAGWAAFNLGKYELSTRDYDDAAEYLTKALKTFELPDQPSNKIELATHGFLVMAYSKMGKDAEATQHCLAIGRMTPFTSAQNYLPLVKAAPMYPRKASMAKREGYAIVEYDVDESGFVRNVKVVDWAGHKSFVSTSIKAAEKFRYAPAFKEGKPVLTVGVQNRFIYELDD